MMDTLEQLKQCFTEDFTTWIGRSNNRKAKELVSEMLNLGPTFNWNKFHYFEDECLQEILNIILRESKADYFWYTDKGELYYYIPKDELESVPSDSLRVDKDKIKALLRDIKINTILNDR